jgi:antitoxin component of MazEF toxin-antitoxin module
METFTTTARRVGNSVGVLIPKEVLEREKLTEGGEVRISISSSIDESLFGRFKGRLSTKGLDDFVRGNKDAW